MTKIDYSLREFFAKHHMTSTALSCYGCSLCVSVCPISNIPGSTYNPKEILRVASMGIPLSNNPTIESVWDCTMCFSCETICPQSIELTELFLLLRNMSAKRGEAPEGYSGEYETVKEHGMSVPIQAMVSKRRKQMGLAEIPQPDLGEVKKLIALAEGDDL